MPRKAEPVMLDELPVYNWQLLTKQIMIKNFIKKWIELLSIPAAFVLWFFSTPFLRLIDPTSATFDAGIFQAIIFALIAFLAFHGVVRLVMKVLWPRVDWHLDQMFNIEFLKVSAWERLKVSLFVFFALFYALIALTVAIL